MDAPAERDGAVWSLTSSARTARSSTFERVEGRWGECWQGKCLFCKRKLSATLDGQTRATIEHILPLNHGGDDSLENIALACGSCNGEKGRNHDNKSTLNRALVDALLSVRKERWRD